MEALNRLLTFYVEVLEHDIDILSIWWVHWFIFPACLYVMLMVIKWAAITMPFWLPVKLALSHAVEVKKNKKCKRVDSNE